MDSSVRNRAFTLIEVLVVLATIAVLIAIVMPALSSARMASAALACSSNLRSCGQLILQYSGDYRGFFPYFADPKAEPAFRDGAIGFQFFQQHMYWTIPLQPYLDNTRLSPVQLCPASESSRDAFKRGRFIEMLEEQPKGFVYPSHYELTATAFASPRLWMRGEVAEWLSFARPVAVAEAAMPSRKGMLIEARPAHRPRVAGRPQPYLYKSDGQYGPFSIAFVDGHVQSPDFRDLTPGFARRPPAIDYPVHDTPDGILGDDLRGRPN